jgi:CRISPR/Cas system-associated exonuclease Cas4 (RecB family)
MGGMDFGGNESEEAQIAAAGNADAAEADAKAAQLVSESKPIRKKRAAVPAEDKPPQLQKPKHFIERDRAFEQELLKDATGFKIAANDTLNINASSLGKCAREVYYARKGFPDERVEPDEQKFIFALGNFIEAGLHNLLSHIRICKGKPRIRDIQTGISGEVDGVVMETVDGENTPIVIEIKSAWEYSFRRKFDEIMYSGRLGEDHYAQVQAYLMLEPKFKYARYILVNKNMHVDEKNKYPAMVSVKVFPDLAEHARIRAWVETLNRALMTGVPPPRQFSRGDWQCNYCAYSDLCYGTYEQEKEDFEGGDCIDETK